MSTHANDRRRMAWLFRRSLVGPRHSLVPVGRVPYFVRVHHPQNFRARLWRWLLDS